MNPAFWKNRRVFLTGHTGFKGSWLSLWLQMLEAEVTGFALAPPTEPSLFVSADVASGVNSILGDILDYDHLRRTAADAQPEIVFHLAAQPLVRESYRTPVETFATNVMGTVHLLESLRDLESVRAIVVVTTDKCYENREWAWGYRENEPLGGHDPYSASKGCAELATAAYRRSFFATSETPVGIATARAGNVIGGGDFAADRIVPDAIRAFSQGKTLEVRNPSAIRPWQHVLDPLAGYLLLAESLHADAGKWSGAWNFGPDDSSIVTVGQVADELCLLWPGAAWSNVAQPNAPHEAHFLKLDCSKARQQLNWKPQLDLGAALRLTADWHREAERCPTDHLALKRFTQQQICHYSPVTQLDSPDARYVADLPRLSRPAC